MYTRISTPDQAMQVGQTQRAILYARVSSHNQVDNTSLDNQIEQCRLYAVEHGFEIVREIREQESGAYSSREGLNIAKELGRQGLADCIIVYKMDRFMRGSDAKSDPGIDAAVTERELNRVGLEVIFLDLPPRDSEAYAWIKAIKRIVASVERENIRARFEDGKAVSLAGGKPAHGGRCPLGYRRNETGYFELVESEASAVRLIYDLFLNGMNVPSITNYLREHNIPGYRNSSQKWGDWIVYDILKREAYYGRYAAIRNRSVRDESRANGYRPQRLPKEEWIYVDVPPIVTKEEWEKVQERLKRPSVQKHTIRQCYYLLSGRVSCECGYAMTGYSVKATRKSGTDLRTRYYMCKGKTNRYALKPCNAKVVRADRLESIVYEWVEKVISDPDFIKQLYERTQEKRRQDILPLQERLDAITVEKLQAETRLKKLARLMIEASDIELSIYTPELENLRNTINYLTSTQAGIEADLQRTAKDEGDFNDFLQYVTEARVAIASKHDDKDFREKAIRAIDLRVTVSLDQKTINVECVVGSDVLQLCGGSKEPQAEADNLSDENVRVASASHRQCTDQTPAPPAPQRVPTPNSPAPP